MTYDIVDSQKKCNERHGKKQKSEQSLDSMSKQLTTVMSTDIVQSNAAAAAAVDSDSSVVDASATASEDTGQHQEPVIGLLLAVC